MSGKFWAGEWPNLNSISIAIDVSLDHMAPAELGILYRLLWFVASQEVHSYYGEPSPDPSFPNDERVIQRIAKCTGKEWHDAKRNVLSFFTQTDGKWRLVDYSVIRLSREARSALPVAVRAAVLSRDGERCVYCGDDKGPFHYDHIWPVSKGGRDEANNIVLSCAPCNLSKSDKTLRDWMARK